MKIVGEQLLLHSSRETQVELAPGEQIHRQCGWEKKLSLGGWAPQARHLHTPMCISQKAPHSLLMGIKYHEWQLQRRWYLEGDVIEMIDLTVLVLNREQGLVLRFINAGSLRRFLQCVLVLVQRQYPRVGQQHPRKAEQQ